MQRNLLSILFLLIFCFSNFTFAQIKFKTAGVGGGGALFSPSINPNNTNQYSVACDMSQVFITRDWGNSYDQIHYSQVQSSHNSKVCYTKDTNILYCITYANDMAVPVKSTNGGVSYSSLSGYTTINELAFGIWVDFNNPLRLIVSQYGAIYFSDDSGISFKKIHTAASSGTGVVVGGVFFDDSKIYIGSSDGIILSNNNGTSFSVEVPNGMPAKEHIWSFAAAKNGQETTFYLLTAEEGNFWAGMFDGDPSAYRAWVNNTFQATTKAAYKYNPNTKTLNSLSTAFDRSKDFPMWIGCAANNPDVIYLSGGSSISAPLVRKSTDKGNSWIDVFNSSNNKNIVSGWSGQGGDRGWSYGEVALGFTVCPNNSDKLIFTDFGYVHNSTNGGQTWQQAYTSVSHPMNTAITPKQDYKSIGIENTTSWQVIWSDSLNIFSCFSDIKGIRSTNGGDSWSFNYTGHNANSMYRVAKMSNGTLIGASSNIHDMYQTTRLQDKLLDANDSEGKLVYSTDKGATWSLIKSFGHPVFWVEIDPNNSNTAYCSVIHYANGTGMGGVYKTTDLNKLSGSTWTKLANPPRTEGHPASLKVLKNGDLLATYGGRRNSSGAFTSSSGVFLYSNQINSWQDISHNGMKYYTKDVVLDPTDANESTWYVCVFSGWGGAPNGLGGLYRTTNKGASWAKIWNSDRVTSITFDPNLNNQNKTQAYLTTEQTGLWISKNINDATPTFENVPEYAFRQPERVFFNPYNSKEMWVTSFGNGMKFTNDKKVISTYQIVSQANPNGTIQPNGIVTANSNESIKFVITPNPNYAIDSLEIDGNKIAPMNEFTFASLSKNHSITANFKSTTAIDYNDLSDVDLFKIANDKLTFNTSFSIEEISQINIVDITGNRIEAKINNSSIDLTQLISGVYFLTVSVENKVYTKSFIISR